MQKSSIVGVFMYVKYLSLIKKLQTERHNICTKRSLSESYKNCLCEITRQLNGTFGMQNMQYDRKL